MTSAPSVSASNVSRFPAARRSLYRETAVRLDSARDATDGLFDLLRDGYFYERPIPERHRLIFYLGHLEAFDWNLLCRKGLDLPAFEPSFDRLFAFGIDPTGPEGRPADQPSDWPSLRAVLAYVRRVRGFVDRALAAEAFAERIVEPVASDLGAVHMAVEHRLMHAETLAYLIHRLPAAAKKPGPLPAPGPAAPVRHSVFVPAGTPRLGLERGVRSFGWDNEYAAHDVGVPAFRIDSRNVTNAEYLAFVEAGGYRERSLWSAEAWEWLRREGVSRPGFWSWRDGAWWYRAMFGDVPLPASLPVYVSHAEASAYARWRRARLPSEAEFHLAAYGNPDGAARSYPWGEEAPSARRGVLDFSQWDPAPVASHPAGDTPSGIADLVGNGWEWTRTPFGPFAGFRALDAYPGYSADFFDGRHYVLKGASPRTAASLLRPSFRNWFQPHYPHVYATFRCVELRC